MLEQSGTPWYQSEAIETAILSGVTLFLVAFTGWLVRVTKNAARDSDRAQKELLEQIKTSAVAAQQSASASAQSAEALNRQVPLIEAQIETMKAALAAARDDAQRAEAASKANYELSLSAQRGWLVVAEMRLHKPNDLRYEFTAILRNVGASPVRDIDINWNTLLRPYLDRTPPYGSHERVSIVPPDAEFPIKSIHFVTGDELEVLRNHRKDVLGLLFFFGTLEYRDIFGIKRSTAWRYYCLDDEKTLTPWREGNEFN